MDQVYLVNSQINKIFLCKNKREKTLDTPIKGKESCQEPGNLDKRSKEDNIPDVEKHNKKTPPPLKNKEDYIGDTNEKTRGSDDSTSETYGSVRKLVKEHKNVEYE